MSATFPSSVKNFLQLQDGVDKVIAQHPNERGDEITAIETLVGALGSGQAYSESFKNVLLSYRRGASIDYKSASDLYVRAGELTIPDASGNVRFRRNSSDLTVNWSNLDTGSEASSTTYYVYACADSSGTTFTIKISTSPSAPSGSTFYQKIGSFYNDGSANIVLPQGVQTSSGSRPGNYGPWAVGTYFYLVIGKDSAGNTKIISGEASTGTAIPLPTDCAQADCQWIVAPKNIYSNAFSMTSYDVVIDSSRVVNLYTTGSNWVG